MIAIIGICYRNYTHHTLYRSCLLIYGIAIIRLLSFLVLDDFEGNANISIAIKLLSNQVLQYSRSSHRQRMTSIVTYVMILVSYDLGISGSV